MKTVSNQTEVARSAGFKYDPERHYVRVEAESGTWEGDTYHQLSDEVDATGADAYRIEADGSKDATQRRLTGHRKMVIMSCSKEHADAKIANMSKASKDQSSKPEPTFSDEAEVTDSLTHSAAISL